MLYIFDKDGTLVGGPGDRPANSPAEQVPLPGVVEKLAALRAAGHKLAIATNQGGVAWGFISRSQAYRLAWDAAEKAGGMDAVGVCPHDPRAAAKFPDNPYARPCRFRKPEPGLLLGLMQGLGFTPADTVFVGDSESDRSAAEAAGVRFVWAKDFFKEVTMKKPGAEVVVVLDLCPIQYEDAKGVLRIGAVAGAFSDFVAWSPDGSGDGVEVFCNHPEDGRPTTAVVPAGDVQIADY